MPAAGERSRAKANGEQFYFTGKPCKNGHIAKRRTGNGLCVECEKAWFADNAEHRRAYINEWQDSDEHRAYMRDYYKVHPEAWRASANRNRDKINARSAQRRRDHPEKVKAAIKRWHQANPEAVRAHKNNNKAKRLAAPGKHTAADIRALFEAQKGRCAYCDEILVIRPPKIITVAEEIPENGVRLIVCGCGAEFWYGGRGRPPLRCPACRKRRSPLPVAYHVDHDVPLTRGGSNGPENLCLSCSACNMRKGDMTGAEFRIQRARTA